MLGEWARTRAISQKILLIVASAISVLLHRLAVGEYRGHECTLPHESG
jgi:hypothetical protein